MWTHREIYISQNKFLALLVIILTFSSVCYGGYTPQETKALAKFRPIVQDFLKDDYERSDIYLIRWLRARELDVEAAADMLVEAKRWRRENRIDGILKEDIMSFPTQPYTITSVDKRGRPVLIFVTNRVDTRKILVAGKKDKLIRWFDQMMEKIELRIREQSAKSPGKNITQAVDIYDFNGYNGRQHGCLNCLSAYATVMEHYEKYFPEVCKALVFVNLPRIGAQLLEVLRPVMSTSTRKALKVFAANKEEFSSYLLNSIPADQLPSSLGGTDKREH